MTESGKNVDKMFRKLVPSSMIDEILCFAFYSSHPKDKRKIDIIICTKDQVIELYNKEILYSVAHNHTSSPSEINIYRNNKSVVFYVLFGEDVLSVLSIDDELRVYKVVTGVDRYVIEDSICCGTATLQVYRKNDAVPIEFDDTFEITTLKYEAAPMEATYSVISNLMQNVTFAKSVILQNENAIKDYQKLHEQSVGNTSQTKSERAQPTVTETGQVILNHVDVLKKSCFKILNDKIVFMFDIVHVHEHAIYDMIVYLHGPMSPTLTYATKVYHKKDIPYSWVIVTRLEPKTNSTIAVIVDLKDVEKNMLGSNTLYGSFFYKTGGKSCIIPIEVLEVTSKDTMDEHVDALFEEPVSEHTILALITTSQKKTLYARCLKTLEEPMVQAEEVFCQHLKMTDMGPGNFFVHRISPYHLLHAVMVVLGSPDGYIPLTIYSRSDKQVIRLINLMYEIVPQTIVVTTRNYRLSTKSEIPYRETTSITNDLNYIDYAQSMIKQIDLAMEHIDKCILKMLHTGDPELQAKASNEIDILAVGVDMFNVFRSKILAENLNGVENFYKSLKEALSDY